MKRAIRIGVISLFLIAFSASQHAEAQGQDPNAGLDVVSEPICFFLINEAPYKVYGSFNTDWYTDAGGQKRRHRTNFRLGAKGEVHEREGYPTDKAEFCSYGPFYPGRKLELTLRTLVPIFACQTRIDQGPLIVSGHRKPEGGTETSVACFE